MLADEVSPDTCRSFGQLHRRPARIKTVSVRISATFLEHTKKFEKEYQTTTVMSGIFGAFSTTGKKVLEEVYLAFTRFSTEGQESVVASLG